MAKTLRAVPAIKHSCKGTASIPYAQTGAKGVTGLVVLTQGLAVAGKVLQLNGRVEMGTMRQIESQIEQQAGMAAFVTDAKPGGELNFFSTLGIGPGQGAEQIGVTAVVRQVRVVVAQGEVVPGARLEGKLEMGWQVKPGGGLQVNRI